MTGDNQEQLDAERVRTLFKTLSAERMGTYMIAAGRDEGRALALYLWNARLGEAFHVALQAVEVALRNSVNSALIAEFGSHCWTNSAYLALIDHDRRADLELVTRRIRNRKLPENNGQVVAGLSLGFWVGMLQARYNPAIWSRHLRTAFPDFPHNRNRKSLAKAVSDIATLRNRISHHEPLLRRDHSEDYRLVMETLGWLCPVTRDWIKPYCRVPEIIRQKP